MWHYTRLVDQFKLVGYPASGAVAFVSEACWACPTGCSGQFEGGSVRGVRV